MVREVIESAERMLPPTAPMSAPEEGELQEPADENSSRMLFVGTLHLMKHMTYGVITPDTDSARAVKEVAVVYHGTTQHFDSMFSQ